MAQLKVFNVNVMVANDNGGTLTLDQLLVDKKVFAQTRPAAIVIAEAERDEANAVARPDGAGGFDPYPLGDIIVTVDQLLEA